jgi:hypothetical protein
LLKKIIIEENIFYLMKNILFILIFSTLTNANLLANSDIKYLKIAPNIEKPKGLFILFVGFGENIEVVIFKNCTYLFN